MAGQSLRHIEKSLAGREACAAGLYSDGSQIALKTVGRHDVGTSVEQLLAFGGGDVAHGGEAVGRMGGGLFERVFRLHIQFTRHLVAIVGGQIVVKRFAVAADATPYRSSVGGKDCSDIRHFPAGIEKTHSGGPFVEMSEHILMAQALMVAYALYNHSGGEGEAACLVVVAVAVERVDTETLPHLAIVVILVGIHAVEFHKNHDRLAGDVPAAHTHAYSMRKHCFILPRTQQRGNFSKIRRWIVVGPYIRTDKDCLVLV